MSTKEARTIVLLNSVSSPPSNLGSSPFKEAKFSIANSSLNVASGDIVAPRTRESLESPGTWENLISVGVILSTLYPRSSNLAFKAFKSVDLNSTGTPSLPA